MFRVGIIGLDNSHAVQFTKQIHRVGSGWQKMIQVVAAVPGDNHDIPGSAARIPGYTIEMERLGIRIVPTIPALLAEVDGILLVTNDGRYRREQLAPIFERNLPVYVDKPVAANLINVYAIYHQAETTGTPLFSASAFRFQPELEAIKAGTMGEISGCDTFGPCPLERQHSDFFWYGIHGIESLLAIMGAGCQSVSARRTATCDLVTAIWPDGRIGTFRGRRQINGEPVPGFGGTVFGTLQTKPLGRFIGYQFLVEKIIDFFLKGAVPVKAEQTLAVYTLMESAAISLRENGREVSLVETRQLAEAAGLAAIADRG